MPVHRLLTIPGYLVSALLVWISLPLLLALAALADLMLTRRFLAIRLVLILAVYLACEIAGLAVSLALWLARGLGPGYTRERFVAAHWLLQAWWAGTLFQAAARLLRMELTVEGSQTILPGPILVFIRHASIVDMLLPAVALAAPTNLRLRYVLKRELQWDPGIDVVGNRLPTVFVEQQSPDSQAEIERVCQLAADLGPEDGLLIHPEGTRFTPARRARAIERLAEADPDLAARARTLRHVLPPKLGGPLALLDASPEADALFVAHVGLEGLANVRDLFDPSLVGRKLQVRMWRVPRQKIPEERGARANWLFDQWARVDAWIGERLEDRAAWKA